VEGLSILANGMGKAEVQDPCQQLSWQFSYLKDQFCFAFFPLSKIIDLHNEVLNFSQKEGESLGAAWSRYNQLALSGPELSIPDVVFMQHFVHELGTKFAEYLDMTSGGVFAHFMVEEGKLILDRILSVTLLEDLQFKAPLISEDELIITYLDTSDISALPAKEEFLQLIASGIGSENKIEDSTPFPLSIKKDCFDDDIGNSSKAPACDLNGLKFEPAGQDLEEYMASKENLLELSAIISRNWSIAVEEDDNYIIIYPDAKAVCCCLQGFSFWMVCYDPRVGLICGHLLHQLRFYSGSWDRTCNAREWFPLPQQLREVRCAWSTTSFITLVRPSS
jgi:hypothetical protein